MRSAGRHVFLALILALMSVFELSLAQDKSAAPVIHRSQAGERGPDGWVLAQSTKGNFSLKLPAKFNDFSMGPMTLTTGGIAEAHAIGGVDQETGAKFIMTCLRYIEGVPTLTVEGSPITHQGCKGYASSGVGAEKGRRTEGQSRAFVVPGGTCIAIVEYPVEARAKVAHQIPIFFNSIDLPGHGCQR